MPATSTTPIETYQRIAALPSNDSDGDMQNGRRKALKSFVLHIRVRFGLRPQSRAARPVPRRYQAPKLNDCCAGATGAGAASRKRPRWLDHGYARKTSRK